MKHLFLVLFVLGFLFEGVAQDSTTIDTDGDGIIDSIDKCPREKGIIQYDGCPAPDTDQDGVADDIDSCLNVAGLKQYNGCPAPDKDGDKIRDNEDRCPQEAGPARYDGCPIKDTDKDGLDDDNDSCINEPGPMANKGCPTNKQAEGVIAKAVEKAATLILFETGNARFKAIFAKPLNEVARIIIENPATFLRIVGPIDNTGSVQSQQNLSLSRAQTIKDYLVLQGVDKGRIEAKGIGAAKLIAANKTPDGRAKNRRVILQLIPK